MDRRTLGYAAAVVVVFALIVGGALAVGGDGDDEPREAAAPPATTAEGSTSTEAERTETQAQDDGRDGAATVEEPAAEPGPAPGTEPAPAARPARYVLFSASSGDWQAELPSENGWQQPAERQLGGGRRIRVTVRGPEGAAVVIDHTPAAPVRFGSKYRSSRELPQTSVGSMTEYRLSDDAVGYVMDAGDGGFRVFATGVDDPVARRVADSLSFVDL